MHLRSRPKKRAGVWVGNVGQTPPPQAAEARTATSAPGGLDAGRGPHFDRFQIGTPERRRSGDEGFGGLSPVRGTGQDASDQQQQPWAQFQNTSWQGAAPVQPDSWGPQGGQGAAVPLYGTGPPPPPPPPLYAGAYHPGSQQQPAVLDSCLRSQAELNQHLAAAITRSGPSRFWLGWTTLRTPRLQRQAQRNFSPS